LTLNLPALREFVIEFINTEAPIPEGTNMAGPGACYPDEADGKKKESVYQQVRDFLDKGETVAVATIVSTKGSTPREVGAKMVVTAWGEILGTIGGGCGEADVKREAIEVIRTRKPRTVRVDLLDDISSDSPAVCGGIMNIFIDPWWKERYQEVTTSR
jgi:xanthine dehydrogenase accessory factor